MYHLVVNLTVHGIAFGFIPVTQAQTITGYKISFSAFPKNGNGRIKRPFYKERLFIQFDYLYDLNGNEEILYLDGQDDYCCRKRLTSNKGLDNGQLCPTNCP